MFNLPKTERLCGKRQIEHLYREGHRLWVFPYSVCWVLRDESDGLPSARMMVSVSKRRFHHAVDRNRVKRLTRECYRLHKPQLLQLAQSKHSSIDLSFSYSHNEILDFDTLYHKMDKIVEKLIASLQKET